VFSGIGRGVQRKIGVRSDVPTCVENLLPGATESHLKAKKEEKTKRKRGLRHMEKRCANPCHDGPDLRR